MSCISISGTGSALQPIIDEINVKYFIGCMTSLCKGYEIRFGHHHIIPCALERLSQTSQDYFNKNGVTFNTICAGIQVDTTLVRIKQALTRTIPGKKLVIKEYNHFGDVRYAIRLQKINPYQALPTTVSSMPV